FTNHSELRADAFIDYNNRTHPHLRPNNNINCTTFHSTILKENFNLINNILLPSSIHSSFFSLVNLTSSLNRLEFYTDGSLSRYNDSSIMGFGWILTSDINLDVKYSERQISHRSLHHIKDFTFAKLINWEYTQDWFNYNPFSKATSQSYSKHVSWHIKCSNYALPTLDSLNRNYPDILKGFDICFLCSTAQETNEHFWTCPESIKILKDIFKKHELIYKALIINNLDRKIIDDSNNINLNSPVFSCFNLPIETISDAKDLHCILINMVPSSLIKPFQDAKISKKLTKKLLLTFLFNLHRDIYEILWTKRNAKWKQYKIDHNITKSLFTNRVNRQKDQQRQNFNEISPNNPVNDNILNIGYTNPFMTSRRNLDDTVLWIYLTSSNFRHNLPSLYLSDGW
ncbi:16402_t:CDS:2, partial [Rhizophagus irregularis]